MTATTNNSHTLTVDGLDIHYWESNPHAPRTMVMLRGFRSGGEGLMKLAREFGDYHLIIPDFPGYGQTGDLEAEHSVLAYADVTASFIAHLGLTDITLLGHSFGALVALICAAKHPEPIRQLVLLAPVPKPTLMLRASSLYYIVGRALPAPLDRHWLTSRAIQNPIRNYITRTSDPLIRADVMSEGERELQELRPKINVENYLSMINSDPTEWIPRLSMPTLVIAGAADRLTRPAVAQKTYRSPLIEVKVVKGLGHYAPSEAPAALARPVRAWLKQPERAPRSAAK